MSSMIRPGLERITRLLQGVTFSWKAIHVAGTNGKGSICSYLSAMLHDSNVRVGRFTSPHIIDRWDGITIDEKPVSEKLFLEVEDRVKWRNEKESIEASSFELLTATAFEIFNEEKVKVGIVECGMGGTLDSTNVLQNPIVTVISRLGMDHQAFLGNTPKDIATHKAGIMKSGTPCVVDAYSANAFLTELVNQAEQKGVDIYFTPLRKGQFRTTMPVSSLDNDFEELFKDMKPTPHFVQMENMWSAYRAFALAIPPLNITNVNSERLASVMSKTVMPGRFQKLDLSAVTGRNKSSVVYLDGAHNDEAWSLTLPTLGFVLGDNHGKTNAELAPQDSFKNKWRGRSWVIACSKGRDPENLTRYIHPNDRVYVVEFGPVAGMPWVEPLPANAYKQILERHGNWFDMGRDILKALRLAALDNRPMIITGSLYLVSDVLRLVRDAESVKSAGATSPIRFSKSRGTLIHPSTPRPSIPETSPRGKKQDTESVNGAHPKSPIHFYESDGTPIQPSAPHPSVPETSYKLRKIYRKGSNRPVRRVLTMVEQICNNVPE